MLFIKDYYTFLSEIKSDFLLYHGSLSDFNEFKNTTTFFSDEKKFALDYANRKSFESGLDSSPILYTCKVRGDIFDINDKSDYDKLYNNLSDENYIYNLFGMKSRSIDKDEFILNLKGFQTIPAFGLDLNIGDTFPNPTYKPEIYKVAETDDDYIYAYLTKDYNYEYNKLVLKDKDLHNFIVQFMKSRKDAYYNDFAILSYIEMFENGGKSNYRQEPTKEEMDEFNRLYSLFEVTLNEHMKKYYRKFTRKDKIVKLSDSWMYYENNNVDDILKKLGYCGYVATEKGFKTYAIFNPNKSVEIIDKKSY